MKPLQKCLTFFGYLLTKLKVGSPTSSPTDLLNQQVRLGKFNIAS